MVNHTTAGNQSLPVMTALADGGFAVFYESGVFSEILGQLFNPDGTRRGVEFTVNTITLDRQQAPAVALLDDGRIAVSWQNRLGNGDGDTSGASIQMQIIDPRGGVVTGNSDANLLFGHDGLADEINGLAGSDILHGLGGNDTIFGGEGGDDGFGGRGDDNLFGGTGSDTLRGQSGEDRLLGEAGNDTLSGGRGDDELEGGKGNDKLSGDEGSDTLTGGIGNDAFIYASLADVGDLITDFSSNATGNNDRLEFAGAAFGNLAEGVLQKAQFQSSNAAVALTADIRFLFERDTGILRFDADGSGDEAAVIVATLDGSAILRFNDIVII